MPVEFYQYIVSYQVFKGEVMLTSSSHIGEVHAPLMAQLRQHQSAYHIATHCLDPVVLAPVDIGPSSLTSAVDGVSRLEFVEDLSHLGRVLHAVVGGMDSLALRIEQAFQVAADPALAAGEEEAVFRVHICCRLAGELLSDRTLRGVNNLDCEQMEKVNLRYITCQYAPKETDVNSGHAREQSPLHKKSSFLETMQGSVLTPRGILHDH